MLKPRYSSQFKKDVRLARRRGRDLAKLEAVVKMLCEETSLPEACKDHPLTGKHVTFRDCHIEPDWILIYQKREAELVLVLARTGSPADLF